MKIWKYWLNMSQHGLKNEHFASLLRVICSVAGHAQGWRGQSAREKSKPSPNLTVGLPQFSREPSAWGQYFETKRTVFSHIFVTLATRRSFLPGGVVPTPVATAARELAQIAIDQAVVANVNPQRIADAQQKMQEGDASIASGDFVSAIQSFQHAWQRASQRWIAIENGYFCAL
jgi:hypothetical protein